MLSVNYNPSVMITQRNIALASGGVFSALERMSTGFRINRAADDAAGMYVATGLEVQIRGLRQAQRNVSDGISLLNTADGALSNMTGLLSRIRDLAVQGGNGVYDDLSREAMQMEADSLIDELYQVRDSAVFNGMKIFGDGVKASAAGVSAVSAPRDSKILAMSDVSALSSNVVPEGYIGIYSAEDLDRVRDNLGGKYILMNDIDLSSFANWDPIGDKGAAFTGVFDGNGHVVKNLTIDRSDENDVGLFGYVEGSTIKNLGVVDANVKGNEYVGIIIGSAQTHLNNLYQCYSTGSVSGATTVGGIAGYGDNIYIDKCYSSANVTGTVFTGGISGHAGWRLNNCYFSGTVTGRERTGGIVGNNWGRIEYCYVTGEVSGINVGATGAIAGGNNPRTIQNCLWDTEKTGVTKVVGTDNGGTYINNNGLTGAEMADPSNWEGWDSSVWDLSKVPPEIIFIIEKPEQSTGNIRLQVGADSDPYANAVYVDTVLELGDFSVDFSTAESCAGAIDDIDELMNVVTAKRSEVGAYINRLESVLDTQITSIENLTAAKSTIMDADIAQESANFVKNQILQQTSAALLSQAQRARASVIMALIT